MPIQIKLKNTKQQFTNQKNMLISPAVKPSSSNLLPTPKPFQTPIIPSPKTPSLSFNKLKLKSTKIFATTNQEQTLSNGRKKKKGVIEKLTEKPRLVLKFIWMKNNSGIGLNQVIDGGNGIVPVSPYFFWPRNDAWDQLRILLESKDWISHKQMVLLLNQATDIINLWQQNGGGLG